MMMMMMTKNDDDNLGFRTSQLLGYSALADINLFGTIRGWLVRYGLMRETVPELFSVKAHAKHQQLLTNVGVCSIPRNGFESESQLESESESELELIFRAGVAVGVAENESNPQSYILQCITYVLHYEQCMLEATNRKIIFIIFVRTQICN